SFILDALQSRYFCHSGANRRLYVILDLRLVRSTIGLAPRQDNLCTRLTELRIKHCQRLDFTSGIIIRSKARHAGKLAFAALHDVKLVEGVVDAWHLNRFVAGAKTELRCQASTTP